MERLKDPVRKFVIDFVAAKTRTFGGGSKSQFNPLVNALTERDPMFAAGVDVGEVVDLVFDALGEAKEQVEAASNQLASL